MTWRDRARLAFDVACGIALIVLVLTSDTLAALVRR